MGGKLVKPEIGMRHGKRVITAIHPAESGKRTLLTLKCDCGFIDDVRWPAFKRNGNCRKCCNTGKPREHMVQPGQVFGGRTVLYEDGYINIHRAVMTRCECGKEQRVTYVYLRQGRGLWCRNCACERGHRREANGRWVGPPKPE